MISGVTLGKMIIRLLSSSLKNLSNYALHQNLNFQNKILRKVALPLQLTKLYSTTTEASKKMVELLKARFPLAKEVEVVDISHGCGAMYEINVASVEFKGLSVVKQHRLINEILKEQIKDMHGLRIQTSVPSENG